MAKKMRELYFVEFDGKFTPRLLIKAKKRLSDKQIREQCERLESRQFAETIRKAQKKAFEGEPLMLVRSE